MRFLPPPTLSTRLTGGRYSDSVGSIISLPPNRYDTVSMYDFHKSLCNNV
ncbi:hypothetical protein FHW00_000570 [Ochrobactrum sp. P6BSIII]|nr:hypothetical protein [Ochrobactrum sp. P6BSIII]